MKKVKILILGGTKFLGIELLRKLNADTSMEVHVASRRDIGVPDFHHIDRKTEKDLVNLFAEQSFDIVVDFISFSQPDAFKLINAINLKMKVQPFLITISSTYVYGNPLELKVDKIYDEDSFAPIIYKYSGLDRPEVDYFEGKKSMESFIARNYENHLVVRFPIILGSNDYTGRTTYFSNLIMNASTLHFDNQYGKSNFIFSLEAAEILHQLILCRLKGAINCTMDARLNQNDILSLYCQYYNYPIQNILDDSTSVVKSPFYYRKDFIIDNSRLRELFTFKTSFDSALFRELDLLQQNRIN